ncbi:hypothetical protein GCM10023215_46090 [Pseudonocardia yuanmonensis]|uniref:Uncharacterized protein n=1 Tax=Pseudonocardia yuanmonensis TaxID=1095914 RepID=A0ABP8X7H4_9PSEU
MQEVATSALAMARREIGAGEFAARSCESTPQTALVWACGTVGQSIIRCRSSAHSPDSGNR